MNMRHTTIKFVFNFKKKEKKKKKEKQTKKKFLQKINFSFKNVFNFYSPLGLRPSEAKIQTCKKTEKKLSKKTDSKKKTSQVFHSDTQDSTRNFTKLLPRRVRSLHFLAQTNKSTKCPKPS